VDRGWRQETFPIHVPGFAEDDLTIDSARAGPDDAAKLLILSSGLHGPEAFFGSASQLAWIDSLPPGWEPPPGTAVLLLHALNPFGFARIRRANEGNVDLNRNFIDADEFTRLKAETGKRYGPLDPYLNPPYPPGPIDWFPLIFLWGVVRFGRKML